MEHSVRKRGFKALLITQFLGAFNDNAFKLVISLLAIDLFVTKSGGTEYLSVAGAVFILPFLLFSTYAGYLADRFSKRAIIIWAKVAELLIMVMGLIAFTSGNIRFMLIVLFLMGTQSAFFGPSKYGIIPEILKEEEISWGNSLITMWTYLAIILGTASGGFLLSLAKGDTYKTAIVFILISLAGIIASFFVAKVSPSGSTRPFQFNFLVEITAALKEIYKKRAIYLSLIGLIYFSLLGGLFQLNILLYARNMMNLTHAQTGLFLTMIALGIGLGSILAGKLSAGKIEFGLVPLGAIGISLFSIMLGSSYNSFARTGTCLFLLGTCAGFFIIPLNSFIQKGTYYQMRGQVLAVNNFLGFSAILLASAIFWILREILKLNPAVIFVYSGLFTIIVTVYICKLLPVALVRLIFWIITHSIYKMKVVARENVPEEGPALLVSNHVSFVDGFLIQFSISRPIRFIVGREMYNNRLFRGIFNLARAIPISADDPPKEIIKALKEARSELENGGLICIFAEGHLTLTGNMLPFNKGFEHIVKNSAYPIIPVHLDKVWGSIFSFERGKFFYKIPKRIPYPVTISFGKSIPASSSAFRVRQAVMELGAEAFKYRDENRAPLPVSFWREAKKHPFKFCMADSTGKKFSYATTLISSMALSKVIKRHAPDEKMIGILLPSSTAGAITNISVSLLDMVAVNINFTTSQEIIESAISQSNIKYIISSRIFLKKRNLPEFKNTFFIEDLIKEISISDKLNSSIKALLFPAKISCKNLATIIFSSGSTGIPKGVMLAHENITSNIEGFYQIFDVKRDDKVLGVLPFFHSFGFTATLWFPLLSGIGVVYHYNPLEATSVGELAFRYKTTILLSTPTFLVSYIHKCKPEQFRSLRHVIVGAEKIKDRISQSFRDKFGILPMEGYGSTELSPIVSVSLPDYLRQSEKGVIRQLRHKPRKVGLSLPGVAVKVVNPETFEELEAGENGLLLAKGANVMLGYLNQPELTKKVMHGDWYITGDIANIDEDGFIELTDRLSRFSKIAGEMVPHIGVEEAIHDVLNFQEQICVVSSVPDEKRGEKLVVLYAKDLNPEEVCKKLNESSIPKLWIPAVQDFYRIETIPVLGSGKLDLKAIKKLAIEIYSNALI